MRRCGASSLWSVMTVAGLATMCGLSPAEAQPPANSGPPARTTTPRTVTLMFPLAYYEDDAGQLIGDCLPARLEVGGAPAGRVRIGVYEPEVGGTTAVWRATTWSAALVAAQLTDFDPRALQLSVESARSTDGPSAGALLTVHLVAAIRGDKLRDDVAMTGTINPDGTIGPVGGLPMKIEGAAKNGKRLVLIPEGQNVEVDERTGRNVNLIEYGQSRGVTGRPVSDIWAAYREFTGVTLHQPEPGVIPRLPPEIDSLVLQRIERWIKLTRAARDKYASWPEYTHLPFCENMIQLSRDSYDRASQMLNQGEHTAAYMDAVSGALYAWMAHEFGRYVYQLPTGSVATLNQLPMQHGWLVKEIDQTTQALRNFKPRTFDQMAMYLNAGTTYVEGLCAFEIAEDLKHLHQSGYMQKALAVDGDEFNSGDSLRQAAFSLFAGVFQIAAWIDMKLTTDYWELAANYGGKPLPEQPELVTVWNFYRRGAEANQTIVNELVVDPAARQMEMPTDLVKAILPMGDPYYGIANVGLTRVLPQLRRRLGDGEQLEYVSLAGAMYLHSVTATLIAKHYSVGVDFGDDLTIVRIHREPVLAEWINKSRRQVEGAIQSLLARGVDVTTVTQIYWLARVEERRPKPEDRFNALQRYFYANLMAQMLGQLSRGSEGPQAPPTFEVGLPPLSPPKDDGPAPPAAPRASSTGPVSPQPEAAPRLGPPAPATAPPAVAPSVGTPPPSKQPPPGTAPSLKPPAPSTPPPGVN